MPLKIIKLDSRLGRFLLILAALLCIFAVWFAVKWNFVAAVVFRIDPERPESKPIVEWVTELGPDDPNAHFATAVLLEKTFDAADLERSLQEYEAAARLSPTHYVIWLGLAKARNTAGDVDGAEAAFRRALELAPNYSTVQWAFGNFLIRQDRADEGFALIARAAAADPKYSVPAVVTAMQLYEGDADHVTRILGDSENITAAIVGSHAGQGRFDEAFAAWSRLPAESRITKFKEQTDKLLRQMTDAKKFQLAARLAGEIRSDATEKPVIGKIANGGFESDIKLRNAGLFEWQVAEGAEPQIGRTGQKRSGDYSLLMAFNTFETAGFRATEQTIAVVGGARYEFEVFYRSDLKTGATLTWEVLDAATLATLSAAPPLTPAADWTSVKAAFTVPADTDGIIIRLSRTGCNGPSCPMSGRLFFDDLTLRRL